jgi:ribosomal protein L16/L10AE
MQQKLHLRRLLRDSNFMVLENAQRFNLGRFGIVSCEPGFITIEQRESIRKLLSRRLKPLDGQF